MKIELYIDGKQKIFTAPFVPMLARRKYFEIEARAEEREEPPTTRDVLNEDDEMYAILTNVVFDNQFTTEQLLEGASYQYIDEKLKEAIHGIKPKKKEGTEKNIQGE